MSLRGMALLHAATLVAELGDFHRFDHPGQLMNYLGLVPSEHTTGTDRQQGGITKMARAGPPRPGRSRLAISRSGAPESALEKAAGRFAQSHHRHGLEGPTAFASPLPAPDAHGQEEVPSGRDGRGARVEWLCLGHCPAGPTPRFQALNLFDRNKTKTL